MENQERPACPYCGLDLGRVPEKTKRCASCGRQMFVRKRPSDRTRVVVTGDHARDMDEEQQKRERRQGIPIHAARIGLTPQAFSREGLLGKNPRDAFLQLSSEAAAAAVTRNDWGAVSRIYSEQALVLREEGRPHLALQQEASKAMIRSFMVHGVRGVAVLSGACCQTCNANHDSEYSFEQALAQLPVPNPSCTREWCNCGWGPAVRGGYALARYS